MKILALVLLLAVMCSCGTTSYSPEDVDRLAPYQNLKIGIPVVLRLRTKVTTVDHNGKIKTETMIMEKEGEVTGLTKDKISVRSPDDSNNNNIWYSGRMIEEIIVLEKLEKRENESVVE